MTDVDYTETHGRGVAISESRKGQQHVTEGEVAHAEMDQETGLMTVYFRDDDAPGGGIVSNSNHTFHYVDR